jgi:rRNA maturation protein Nop10
MGSVLRADCPACGYGARISAGHGGEGVEMEPHVCLDCCEIVDVAVAAGDDATEVHLLHRCPDCGGDNLRAFHYQPFYEDLEPLLLSDGCPKCGTPTYVSSVGIWD